MPMKRISKLEPLLNTDEAARQLGLEATTLATWRHTRGGAGLPYVKLGAGRVRYRPSDIREFIATRLQAA